MAGALPHAWRHGRATPAHMEARLEGGAGGRREKGGAARPLPRGEGGWMGQRVRAVEGGVVGLPRKREVRSGRRVRGRRGRRWSERRAVPSEHGEKRCNNRMWLKLNPQKWVSEGEFRCPPKFWDPSSGLL